MSGDPVEHLARLDASAAPAAGSVSVSAVTAREAALALRLRATEVNPDMGRHLRRLADEFDAALAAL